MKACSQAKGNLKERYRRKKSKKFLCDFPQPVFIHLAHPFMILPFFLPPLETTHSFVLSSKLLYSGQSEKGESINLLHLHSLLCWPFNPLVLQGTLKVLLLFVNVMLLLKTLGELPRTSLLQFESDFASCQDLTRQECFQDCSYISPS